MMCGDIEGKKPRLFYYEDAVDAWIPAPEQIEDILDIDSFSFDEEVIKIRFKRFDMTDHELDNLPED
jgi:hypothetical protein